MAESQAERKQKEARRVTWIGRAIGVSSLGITGVLSVVASAQSPDSVLFQSVHAAKVANYDTTPLAVTEVVVEVPVPSPLPPTHVPAAAGGRVVSGGSAAVYRQPAAPGAPPPAVVHVGVVQPPPAPLPAPTAVTSGSVPH